MVEKQAGSGNEFIAYIKVEYVTGNDFNYRYEEVISLERKEHYEYWIFI